MHAFQGPVLTHVAETQKKEAAPNSDVARGKLLHRPSRLIYPTTPATCARSSVRIDHPSMLTVQQTLTCLRSSSPTKTPPRTILKTALHLHPMRRSRRRQNQLRTGTTIILAPSTGAIYPRSLILSRTPSATRQRLQASLNYPV